MMTTVLIVDDHPVVRRGLRQILQDQSDLSIVESGDGRDALSKIKQEHFDLAIVDFDLPRINGLDLLKEIKLRARRLPVLILSMYPEDQVAIRLLKAGASGFVSKETAADELVVAIRKILAGANYISERVADLLVMHARGSTDGSLHEKLSDREFQILALFGEGKTVKEIAEQLCLSVPTVSTYRTRIFNKMDMKTTAELVRYAIQHHLSHPK